MWELEICFSFSSIIDATKLFMYCCTWSRFGNSGDLPSWPVCDPLTAESDSFLHSNYSNITYAMCRDTLTIAWPPSPPQGVSERCQRWVCTHLGSGGRFSLSSVIAKLLCNRTSPRSQITSAVIIPSVLVPVSVESLITCHATLGSMHGGTVDTRGHGSQSSCWWLPVKYKQ